MGKTQQQKKKQTTGHAAEINKRKVRGISHPLAQRSPHAFREPTAGCIAPDVLVDRSLGCVHGTNSTVLGFTPGRTRELIGAAPARLHLRTPLRTPLADPPMAVDEPGPSQVVGKAAPNRGRSEMARVGRVRSETVQHGGDALFYHHQLSADDGALQRLVGEVSLGGASRCVALRVCG